MEGKKDPLGTKRTPGKAWSVISNDFCSSHESIDEVATDFISHCETSGTTSALPVCSPWTTKSYNC